MRRLRTFAATILLVAAADVFAANTDVIVLKNGDRFTGEVKQLTRGQLKVGTDDAGTISIEWDKIAAVTTALPYEVETAAGENYVGSLAPDAIDMLRVIAEDGTATRLSFLDVVALAPIRSGFFERIDGSVDIGGSYTKSSGVGQTSTSLDAAYRRPLFEAYAKLSSNATRESAGDTSIRFTLNTGYSRFRRDRWIINPFLFAERNADLGVSWRGVGALAIGRYLQRSNRSSTLLAAGGGAGRERSPAGTSTANVDALVMGSTSFYTYDYPKSSMDLSLLVFPELNQWGRVRANFDAKLKRELVKDFYAAATLYDTFDSRPPDADVRRNDIGVTLSIGWTF